MKSLKLSMRIIHLFVGIGALFGGMAGILSPSGNAVGMSVEVLRNGPFKDFLVPGIFLFVVIGLGNIITSITSKHKYHAYLSGCFGVILCMWIIIQCYMLFAINILHIIFFIIGAVQIALAVILAFKNKLFPTGIIYNYLEKCRAFNNGQ